MPQLKSTIEILKMLDQSNCGECREKTCLAFAAAVFTGRRQLRECPHLDRALVRQYEGNIDIRTAKGQELEERLEILKRNLSAIDFQEAARRLGGRVSENQLILKVCGKDFRIDSDGNFSSEIHVHAWLTVPVLNYIIKGKGLDPSGEWVPFRELKGGKDWILFFRHRAEKSLKKVADEYTDLFHDMLYIFNGKQVENHYESDISLVLYPLPKIPILFCYWRPDDGLDSDLHVFFDATAADNLPAGSLYSLMMGLVIMFEKVAQRHG